MHTTIFLLERAYQSTWRITGPLAAKYGLTPARVDMLYAVHLRDRTIFRQRELRDVLGVSGATVSRMLKSLEELGFLFRCIDPDDARHQNVGLTPKGRTTIQALVREVLEEGLPHLALDVAIAHRRWFDEPTCVARTRSTNALLHRIASTFYDSGSLEYRERRRVRPIRIVLRPEQPSSRTG